MGADKRIAPPEEFLRLFQEAGKIYVDEILVENTKVDDIDFDYFKSIFLMKHKIAFEKTKLDLTISLDFIPYEKPLYNTLHFIAIYIVKYLRPNS